DAHVGPDAARGERRRDALRARTQLAERELVAALVDRAQRIWRGARARRDERPESARIDHRGRAAPRGLSAQTDQHPSATAIGRAMRIHALLAAESSAST